MNPSEASHTAEPSTKSTPRHRKAARRGRSADDRALAERLLATARAGGDVRRRKVRRLRAKIKVKVYENELKLAIAFERLLKLAAKPPLKLKPVPRPDAPAPLSRPD